MDNSIAGQDGNNTVSQSLVANSTNSLLSHDNSSIPASLTSWHSVAKQKSSLGIDEQRSSHSFHNSAFGQSRIRCTNAATKVGLQLLDRQIVGYEGYGR